MTIKNYWDGLNSDMSWSVIELEDCFISVNDLEPNVICSNGRCWAPPPTDLDEHILIIKRQQWLYNLCMSTMGLSIFT